jgi:hypothetical protein
MVNSDIQLEEITTATHDGAFNLHAPLIYHFWGAKSVC